MSHPTSRPGQERLEQVAQALVGGRPLDQPLLWQGLMLSVLEPGVLCACPVTRVKDMAVIRQLLRWQFESGASPWRRIQVALNREGSLCLLIGESMMSRWSHADLLLAMEHLQAFLSAAGLAEEAGR